jgi:hypothetical protein
MFTQRISNSAGREISRISSDVHKILRLERIVIELG